MTDSSPADHNHETGSYSENDLVDRLCDQFERELKAGSLPKIEEYLPMAPPTLRDRLLRELETRQLKNQNLAQNSNLTGDQTIVVSPETNPQFSHFRLLEVAGTGGFGTVWRARDLRLDRDVAIKIPRSDRTDTIHLSGLLREAKAAAKLKHPNIVTVHEIGEENGTSFIVTDFVQGVNLREWRKQNPLSPHDAARLVAKLAMAVQHAHEKGIIHRDLKLGNVLMDMQGEPHVADFGLAKSEARDDSLAITGQVMGTPAYMAPEQARADHQAIDRRTDVYSLGVMLYELMTGTTPFRGNVPEILQQLLNQPPVSPRKIKPEIPKDLEAICLKCLAKENDKRYDSAKALADDLYLFLGGETLRGIPASMPNRVWKWLHRKRQAMVITSTLAILVALTSSSLMVWRYRSFLPITPKHTVEFTTEPPGCEITVVAIDPVTGEPDATKIEKARGRSPLKMSLLGGDYLVVAVLDSLRFNEAYRHVPLPDETKPMAYQHRYWRKQKDGVITFRKSIVIPQSDVSEKMEFFEGSNSLEEPKQNDEIVGKRWHLPPFYADRFKATKEDLLPGRFLEKEKLQLAEGEGFVFLDQGNCVAKLENIGKRLPSAAELYYLAKQSETGRVEGLFSDKGEWTMTRPGGPFTGSPPTPQSDGFNLGMIGFGDPTLVKQETITGFRPAVEVFREGGCRGVRSSKPRLKKEDFIRPIVAPPNQ